MNLVAKEGSIVGLSGVNGSGKTMLMRAISGLIRPTSGQIYIDNELLGKDISFPRSIGFLIESPAFIDSCNGFDNLKMIASIKAIADERAIKHAIEKVGLDPGDKRKYRKYSLGMKQRLGIAAAIMERPDILLLDEPTNALDAEGCQLFEKLLLSERNRGATIILSCHDRSFLMRLSDSIYYLESGKIVRKLEGVTDGGN